MSIMSFERLSIDKDKHNKNISEEILIIGLQQWNVNMYYFEFNCFDYQYRTTLSKKENICFSFKRIKRITFF